MARGGIEPPTFRFSDGSSCGTDPFVLVRPDKLAQQSVVEPLVPTLTADNRRTDSTPAQGHGAASPRRVSGWPSGAPRALLYLMSGGPLHHTTGNHDQRLATLAEQFDVLPRHLPVSRRLAGLEPADHDRSGVPPIPLRPMPSRRLPLRLVHKSAHTPTAAPVVSLLRASHLGEELLVG